MSGCILCGIDNSAGERQAAPIAARLARDLDAQALLIHVIDESPVLPRGLRPPRPGRARKIKRRLRAIAEEQAFPSGTKVRVETGTAAATLTAVAEEEDSMLIVVAAHATGPAAAAILGGVTSRLIREAPCPVVVVPAKTIAPLDSASLQDVICGVAANEPARDLPVLKLAADLASRLGGNLHAVHAYDPGQLPPDAAGPQRRLSQIIGEAQIEARASVVPLPPPQALQTLASRQRAGLIVVGSQGVAARDSALHGSVVVPLAAEGSTALVVLPAGAELEAGSGHYELAADAA